MPQRGGVLVPDPRGSTRAALIGSSSLLLQSKPGNSRCIILSQSLSRGRLSTWRIPAPRGALRSAWRNSSKVTMPGVPFGQCVTTLRLHVTVRFDRDRERARHEGAKHMTLIGLIIFLLIGAVAGWLAGVIMKGGGFGPLSAMSWSASSARSSAAGCSAYWGSALADWSARS
jgi:hypothetical protein